MPPRSVLANVDSVRITLTGTTDLVMDNIVHAADPDDPITQEIDKITAKKKNMTAEDRARKDRLAYVSALYVSDDRQRLVLPWYMMRRALTTGAYFIGGSALSGKTDKGISCLTPAPPLEYGGPEPDKLYEDQTYWLRAIVNKTPTSPSKSMVVTIRPKFPAWSVTYEVTMFNDIIGFDALARALHATGATVGIGNARKLGYGRFSVRAEKTAPAAAPA